MISNDDKQIIEENYKNGLTINEIKKKYKFTRVYIRKVLKKLGYNVPSHYLDVVHANANFGKKYTKEEKNNILNEYLSGQSITNIAQTHKRTCSAIKIKLMHYGFGYSKYEISEVWPFYNKPVVTCSISNEKDIYKKYNINEQELLFQCQRFAKRKCSLDNDGTEQNAKKKILKYKYNITLQD